MTQKKEKRQAALDQSPGQKKFAGREPLAELSPSDETKIFSLRELADATVTQALKGGLTREKAKEVLAALPK
ncbi:MAG TPA: hypothetical protein VLD37_02250 [Candidatus Bilamarchaeum sp.]|nr:hypothetical protein [Candidatus Bilamarchaeum sp.]